MPWYVAPWKTWIRIVKQDKIHLLESNLLYDLAYTHTHTHSCWFDSDGWVLSCFILHIHGCDSAKCPSWLRESGYIHLAAPVHTIHCLAGWAWTSFFSFYGFSPSFSVSASSSFFYRAIVEGLSEGFCRPSLCSLMPPTRWATCCRLYHQCCAYAELIHPTG